MREIEAIVCWMLGVDERMDGSWGDCVLGFGL